MGFFHLRSSNNICTFAMAHHEVPLIMEAMDFAPCRLTVSAVSLSLLAKAAGPLYGNWWAVADSTGSTAGFAGRALLTVGKQVLKGVSTLRAGGAYGLQVLLNRRFRGAGGRGSGMRRSGSGMEGGGEGDELEVAAAAAVDVDDGSGSATAVDEDQREAAAVARGAAALERELLRRRAQEAGGDALEAPSTAGVSAATVAGRDSGESNSTTPEGFVFLPSSPAYNTDATAAAAASAAAAVAAAAAASAGPTGGGGGGSVTAGPTGGGGRSGAAAAEQLPPQELLYFFQSLDGTVVKAWGMLRDQLKRRITPLLAQCMCAPSSTGGDATGAAAAGDLSRGASQELALAKEGAGVLLGLGVSGVNIGLGPRMGIAVSSEGGSAGEGGVTNTTAAAAAGGGGGGGGEAAGGAGGEAMDKKHLLAGHAVVVGSAVVSKAAGEAELQSYRSWCELVGVLHSSLTTLRDAGVPKGLIASLMQQVGWVGGRRLGFCAGC